MIRFYAPLRRPLLQPCSATRPSGAARLSRYHSQPTNHKKRMTAEVGPAHQRAREFLARAAGDETYGKLVDENFDAGAFADEIIQRDRQRSLDDTGPSAAVAAVDAIKAYKVQLQTHIEDHVEESREALLKSSRGLRALRATSRPSHSRREKPNARPTR